MMAHIKCSCGRTFQVDSALGGARVPCPHCGRMHTVVSRHDGGASTFDTSVGAVPRESAVDGKVVSAPVLGAILAVLVICLALLWALLAGGGSGQGGPGDGGGPGGDGGTGSDAGDGSGAGIAFGDRMGRGSPGGGQGVGRGTEDRPGNGSQPDTRPAGRDPTSAPAKPTTPKDQEPKTPRTQPRRIAITKLPVGLAHRPPEAPTSPPPRSGTGQKGTAAEVFGSRNPNGRAAGREYGATPESETAVDRGLAWLASVQKKDGRWKADGRGGDLGHTGLALLAFLGAGNTSREGKYKDTVRRALDWIGRNQQRDGRLQRMQFSWPEGSFYDQGVATMALCEDTGMTGDKRYRMVAQKAVDVIVLGQSPKGGFGYAGPGDDTHLTSFLIMALKSARLAGLTVPKSTFTKLRSFLDNAINRDGTTGYDSGDSGEKGSVRTACGLFSRLFINYDRRHPDVIKIAKLVDKVGPNIASPLHTYNSTYAMFQMGGDHWRDWNPRFRDPVVARQVKTGRFAGSWPPSGRGWGKMGRVGSTAVYIMALEVYYRYKPAGG